MNNIFFKGSLFLICGALLSGCAGGGGRAGSEIPSTTTERLPQRGQTDSAVESPQAARSVQPGMSASRSEPVIYDYPGATRNLNAPTVAPQVLQRPAPVKPVTSTPSATASRSYTVVSGDTLWGIAKRNSVTVEALRNANALTSDLLKPGQLIVIP